MQMILKMNMKIIRTAMRKKNMKKVKSVKEMKKKRINITIEEPFNRRNFEKKTYINYLKFIFN